VDVCVVRHTRLDIEIDRCYGQSEVALAPSFGVELGELQSSIPQEYAAIYSSPLQRCQQLARQFGGPLQISDKLLEYNFGDWELQRWNDIDQAALDRWMQNFVEVCPPNGETLLDMYARVSDFIDDLRQSSCPSVLLVTHAGVIRCIWAYLLAIPLASIFKLKIGYGEPLRFTLAERAEADVIYTGPANKPGSGESDTG
jgi:alpha-ribazole phosphatase